LLLIIFGLVRLRHLEKKRLKRLNSQNDTTAGNGNLPPISVVISARNEEHNLPGTLQSLLQQNYPADLQEIIVVDDRSHDRTAEVVGEYSSRSPQIKLIRQTVVTEGFSPKKQALAQGIAASHGEIILTTDADCVHDPDWVRDMVAYFTPKVGMVAGQARFVLPKFPPLWQRLQALDFQGLGYASAGLIAAGKPFHCTGASLAFRRKLFEEVGGWKGYEHLISGDDELLMAKAARSRWKIVAAASPHTIVGTKPVSTLSELWQQRIRWGSKGMYYSFARKFVLVGIFLFLLSLIAGPLIGLAAGFTIGSVFGKYWALWVLYRFVLDWSAFSFGCLVFFEKHKFIDFFLTEIIYPPATVAFAIAGHFTSFRWKGQDFRSTGGG
jgi:cellulose synthase/poly-beta-1,6-N-acetylglucosamine synthase-like glycosyltransferase